MARPPNSPRRTSVLPCAALRYAGLRQAVVDDATRDNLAARVALLSNVHEVSGVSEPPRRSTSSCRPRSRSLARVALDIERRPAREAKELGFVPRALVQANLPYRRVEETTFSRRAGKLRLHLQTPPGIGLPYGRYPRLLLAWVATEAVRTREPRLELGRSLSVGVPLAGTVRGSGPRPS